VPRRMPVEILRANLREHPAVEAWSALRPARVEPESIHVFREGQQSAIYRLERAGAGGGDITAKRCAIRAAAIERAVYEDILPGVPVTAPHYHGAVEAGESCWLFLEDVGGESYSERDEAHYTLAGRWLGAMHTSAAGVAAATRLPDGRPHRYLTYLRSTRETILNNLANPLLTGDDVAVLEAIVSQCDALEAH